MAQYKFVNADQLDADLTAVADKIRAKGGTSAQLAFPSGYEAAIEAISTGVELNFDVVAYATEAELLADTPKENTIGVITSIPITGYHFGTEEPSPAAAGMVWITTGTSSDIEFNALKKNAIQVYPLSAKQQDGSAWVDVTALSYQGGEWVDWIVYLYKDGGEFEESTGGWEISKSCGGTISKNDDSIAFDVYGVAAANSYGVANTVAMVDLTNVSELTINSDWLVSTSGAINTYTWPRFGVSKTKPRSYSEVCSPTAYISSGKTLDVSSLTGEYYIFVGVAFNGQKNYTATIKMTEVAEG